MAFLGINMSKFASSMTAFKANNIISTLLRFYSINSKRTNICIVGSGPAGSYAATYLVKNPEFQVDIFEKMPVPFGLIRYGVAPDHPKIKKAMNIFTKDAMRSNYNFYGNVNVGKDVSVEELLQSYNAVVLAYGASQEKVLGIPGENSTNVLTAKSVVGWYNGHPDFVDLKIDLDTEVAAIVGVGNVALDIARIFLRKVEDLKSTDISEHAYEALKRSRIKRVVLIGRRGPLQAAFSTKEYKEMSEIDSFYIEMPEETVRSLPVNFEELGRQQRRLAEYIYDSVSKEKIRSPNATKCLELKFCRIPKAILSDPNGRVEKLVLNVNEVEGTYSSTANFKTTDNIDILDCGMVVTSLGYKGVIIDPFVPFNVEKGIIPSQNCRVQGIKGLYCTGWIQTGAIGVIAQAQSSGQATSSSIKKDKESGELPDNLPQSPEFILNLLKNRGVNVVTFEDWQTINKCELERGEEKNKSRDLIYNTEEMLRIVEKGRKERY